MSPPRRRSALLAEEAPPCDVTQATEGTPEGLDPDLGWAIGALTTRFRKLAAPALSDIPGGLRGFLVLSTVSEVQPPSQLALAQQLGFDKSVMTLLVDGLETAGLLQRVPDPADRRARRLLITGAGHDARESARLRLNAAELQLLAPLSQQQAAGFRTALLRIVHADVPPSAEMLATADADGCS